MNAPLLQEIPYRPDTPRLFDALADRPWSFLLDSGGVAGQGGGMDVIVSDPSATLVTRGTATEIRTRGGSLETAFEDPFELLRRLLGDRVPRDPALPFPGGAVGFFGYDLARRLERLPAIAAEEEGSLPDMAIGVYDWALVVDHDRGLTRLVGQGRDPETARGWRRLVERFSRPPPGREREPFRVTGAASSSLSYAAYCRAFARIQRYIRDGDCYQVNFAQRFESNAAGDPWLAYLALRRRNPAPYGAYLATPWGEVMSCSPESFLKVTGREVETRPIKGTVPRGADAADDERLRERLLSSEKDRAENLMIVDLLRNDLSKSCEPHSVRVPELFRVESFATVHHLVSRVTGRLAPGRDALSLLAGAFPGGSITGAPKIRAMEIIEALEPVRRGIYCGAIGYLGFDGSMETNIAIRTLTHRAGLVRFSAGGGIVADSRCRTEYRETLDKVRPLLELFGTPSDPVTPRGPWRAGRPG